MYLTGIPREESNLFSKPSPKLDRLRVPRSRKGEGDLPVKRRLRGKDTLDYARHAEVAYGQVASHCHKLHRGSAPFSWSEARGKAAP